VERTYLMIKPDGVQRGLIGEIIGRFERKGLKLIGAKLLRITMVWEGEQAVQHARALIGKTNALEAAPGTIRSDFALTTRLNLIHGSDSPASAEREIAIFFKEDELVRYDSAIQNWI
jgi:nucleoside-diphosphate kinase